MFGGEGGVRTLDTLLTYTHFPGVRLQPLGHLTKGSRSRTFGRFREGRTLAENAFIGNEKGRADSGSGILGHGWLGCRAHGG